MVYLELSESHYLNSISVFRYVEFLLVLTNPSTFPTLSPSSNKVRFFQVFTTMIISHIIRRYLLSGLAAGERGQLVTVSVDLVPIEGEGDSDTG